MKESRFTVNHVQLTADRPFAEVKPAFERRLGRFDPEVQKALAEGGDPEAARARIEEMVGPSGFMLFGTSDHGSLLRIVGRPRKAVQYVVGNPLFAVEMTRHSIGVALYAPLRVLIFPRQPRSAQVLTADSVQQQPIAAPKGSEINHGIHRNTRKRESESTSPFRVLAGGNSGP